MKWNRKRFDQWINGSIVNVGSSQLPGPNFTGNCSIGGVWYSASDFPAEWKNTYFHADYGGDWIMNFSFDANNNPTQVRNFKAGADGIVFIATDPISGGLYYIAGASGGNPQVNNAVRRITFTGGNLPPFALASSDIAYGTSPLTVNFKGDLSYDPNGDAITYDWDFGDGNSSSEANPSHTFSTGGSQPTSFTVTLTVSDGSLSEEKTLVISLNNTPPQILSTSIDNINLFSSTDVTTLNLNATVNDVEHSNSQLNYEWFTELHHNNHFHTEPADNNASTTSDLSPVGCDGATYFYRIKLKVTDPAGLSNTYQKDIFPDCNGSNQTISFNSIDDKLVIDPPFQLTGSTSSGLPVIFHVISGPASISGNTLTLSGIPGIVTVRAIQSGNNTYAPATPVEHTFTVNPAGGTGLTGNYFNNMNLTDQVLTRIDPTINFNWGTGSPDPSIGVNTFSVRWEGAVLPLFSENYTFTVTGDDGVRLWVNDQLIVNQWVDQSPTAHSGTITLNAGEQVPIRLEYYENGGGAVARLQWSSASQGQQIVPKFLLFPEFETTDTERPTVTLSTPSNDVTSDFVVTVNFNEAVTSLTLNDFNITNGTASALSGSGSSYAFTVTPFADGAITVRLPANRAEDVAGNQNRVSNTLTINYTAPNTGDCSNPSNLALNKITNQSTIYGGGGAEPELAVDGNTNGNWYDDYSVSSTSWGAGPWWEVDLESISEITTINVWNRTDCCSEFLSNYYILISDAPFTSDNLNDLLSQSAVTSFHKTTMAASPTTININASGRYVRIQNSEAGFVALAEVEVFGCADGSNPGGGDTTPPEINLSTSNTNVSAAFTVDATFSENVTGLNLNDFDITNGSASGLNGSGSNYSFTVTPMTDGTVTVRLPADRVADAATNGNNASNLLSVNYAAPGGGNGDCTNPTNVALNKPATLSVPYNGSGAGAELAVDGNTDGNWYSAYSVASSSWSNQPWWEVDLEAVYTLDYINIWNRSDCCMEFLSDYYILVSDVPFSSGSLDDVLNQAGVTAYHQTTEAGTPTAVTIGRSGRYIRIQNSEAGFMALAEVEVFGCIDNNGGDTTPPEVTLSSSTQNATGNFGVTATFTEAIAGLSNSDFSIINGSATGLNGSGQTYSLVILPQQAGDVIITLPAETVTDNSGNPYVASNTITVSYDPPPIPTINLFSPTEGSIISGDEVIVDYQVSGDLTNYEAEHLLLTLDGNPPVDIHNIGTAGSYTFTGVEVGSHTLLAQLADNAHVPLNFPESQAEVNCTTIGNGGGTCTVLENLALNGSASQSSLYSGGGATPELAIDGNTSGVWFGDYSVSSTS